MSHVPIQYLAPSNHLFTLWHIFIDPNQRHCHFLNERYIWAALTVQLNIIFIRSGYGALRIWKQNRVMLDFGSIFR